MLSIEQAPRPSRAQILRDSVEIRLAVDGAGPAIAAVLEANDIRFDADWSVVYPHWLIATVDDDVIGCCQVLPSMPVGYLEFLFVKPDVSFKLRAIAIRKLLIQGMGTLEMAGCQYVGGVVGTNNKKFAEVIGKLGFKNTFGADLHVARLR